MKTFDTAMAKNYDWSMLPFKPDDAFLKRMMNKFELVARTSGNKNYWIDLPGFEECTASAPNTLFHAFVKLSVEKSTRKAREASMSIYDYMGSKER
jgi:hypothetical protein